MSSSAHQLGREGPEQMKASKATYTSNGWLLPEPRQGPKLGRELRCCSKGETDKEQRTPMEKAEEGREKVNKGVSISILPTES